MDHDALCALLRNGYIFPERSIDRAGLVQSDVGFLVTRMGYLVSNSIHEDPTHGIDRLLRILKIVCHDINAPAIAEASSNLHFQRPFHYIVMLPGSSPQIARIADEMIEIGADPSLGTVVDARESLLGIFARHMDIKRAKRLLELKNLTDEAKNRLINGKDRRGRTPLAEFALMVLPGYSPRLIVDFASLLIKHGASLQEVVHDDHTYGRRTVEQEIAASFPKLLPELISEEALVSRVNQSSTPKRVRRI